MINEILISLSITTLVFFIIYILLIINIYLEGKRK